MSFLKLPLLNSLSVILPAANETLLLRACLQKGESGKDARRSWVEQHPDFHNELNKETAKAFLPLLFYALQSDDVKVHNAFLTVIRTAALREELRTKTYRNICHDVFSNIAARKIPMMVVGGAAMADTVYPAAALRHSHDIDILLEEQYLGPTLDLLKPLGFASRQIGLTNHSPKRELIHLSGLPLQLHHHMFEIPLYNLKFAELWSHRSTAIVGDVPVNILCPAHALLRVCGHAFYSLSRESLRWASDAWFIIDRYSDLDWDLFVDYASRTRLALPLSIMLGYLENDLNAPIPTRILDHLLIAASKTNSTGREFALLSARVAPRGGLRNLVKKANNWRSRAAIIKWLILPSPTYLLMLKHVGTVWQLPFYYVYRPIRYVAKIIWANCKHQLARLRLWKSIQTRIT